MIVTDASVVVDLLLGLQPQASRIASRFVAARRRYAPHLLDAEVAQVIRRHVLVGQISSQRAAEALQDLLALPLRRYPHTALIERAFELRDNATVYDALYLALAEALDATLLTRDAALATVPGHSARVEVIAP